MTWRNYFSVPNIIINMATASAAETKQAESEPEFQVDGELIAQGAEAKVYKWRYEDKVTVVKHRFAKKYRHPQLDLKLRRNRSKKEQKWLRKAKAAGLRVPEVFHFDAAHCAMHMEWVDLPTVKAALMGCYDAASKTYEAARCTRILAQMGRSIGTLHASDIVHGDLTTSNLLLKLELDADADGEVVVIDFGLSEGSTRIEDKAVDLYVLERALVSTHPESGFMVDAILEAYAKFNPKTAQSVLRRLHKVRLRGRKRSMIG